MKLTKKELIISKPIFTPVIDLNIDTKYGKGITAKKVKSAIDVSLRLANKIKNHEKE